MMMLKRKKKIKIMSLIKLFKFYYIFVVVMKLYYINFEVCMYFLLINM